MIISFVILVAKVHSDNLLHTSTNLSLIHRSVEIVFHINQYLFIISNSYEPRKSH